MTAKKPAQLRVLEGNRGKRPIPQNELTGIGKPEPPANLTPEALDRWKDIVASLPVGLLTRADTSVLERMAIAWATYRHTTTLIDRAGLLTRSSTGEAQRNPLLVVRKHAALEMDACGAQLGLSPLARTRLQQPDAEAADPLDVLMGRRA